MRLLHRFGPFELDEDARLLTLHGRPQDIQPLVFNLLAYLVLNGGRVVPKAELMDVLWPDLNVTEASLQRAVSLARRALAAGGLERAIRSFVRHGYRFGIDPDLRRTEPAAPAADADLEKARQRARARDWASACASFERIPPEALGLDDLELWSSAVECSGRPVDATPILARAVPANIEAGEPTRAARAAVNLAKIELERGAAAAASGWLGRGGVAARRYRRRRGPCLPPLDAVPLCCVPRPR